MAKNSTLADLDAFLKEQETSSNSTKKIESSYTKEEFVSRNPHQIIETKILAQTEKLQAEKERKIMEDQAIHTQDGSNTSIEAKSRVNNIASENIDNLVPPSKKTDSIMVQWSKAIDETVKGSEVLRSVPFLSNITESSTEQLEATEKFLETSQNIWKKFWR